jgi:hypothetical protein
MSEVKSLKKYFPGLLSCEDTVFSDEGDLIVTMEDCKFALNHVEDEKGEMVGVALLEPRCAQTWVHVVEVTPELDAELWAMRLIAEKFKEIRGS